MNNADQPAHPTFEGPESTGPYMLYNGLTKREYYAGLAMQGLLSRYYMCETPLPLADVAKDAVEAADELLKALES